MLSMWCQMMLKMCGVLVIKMVMRISIRDENISLCNVQTDSRKEDQNQSH